MWWRGSYDADAKVVCKGDLPISELFNLYAEGNVVLLDSSPSDTHVVKGAVDASRQDETLEEAIAEAIKRMYFVRAFVVFGSNSTVVRDWMLARGTGYRRAVDMHTLRETGQDVLRSYSFLSADSSWEQGDNFVDSKIPHRISEFLFLGDYSAATSPIIHSLGIRHIVNASGFENKFEAEGVKYVNINLWDSPSSNIKEHFDATADFIEAAKNQNSKVLVHCAAGISRSTSLLLAYLMKKEKMDLKSSYLHVKQIRSIVQPNTGFVLQLIEYEKELFGSNSVLRPTQYQRHFGLSDLIKVEMEQSNTLNEDLRKLLKDDF